jgi:hypothetical protein
MPAARRHGTATSPVPHQQTHDDAAAGDQSTRDPGWGAGGSSWCDPTSAQCNGAPHPSNGSIWLADRLKLKHQCQQPPSEPWDADWHIQATWAGHDMKPLLTHPGSTKAPPGVRLKQQAQPGCQLQGLRSPCHLQRKTTQHQQTYTAQGGAAAQQGPPTLQRPPPPTVPAVQNSHRRCAQQQQQRPAACQADDCSRAYSKLKPPMALASTQDPG